MRAGKIQFDRISPPLDNSWDFGAMKSGWFTKEYYCAQKSITHRTVHTGQQICYALQGKKMLYTAHWTLQTLHFNFPTKPGLIWSIKGNSLFVHHWICIYGVFIFVRCIAQSWIPNIDMNPFRASAISIQTFWIPQWSYLQNWVIPDHFPLIISQFSNTYQIKNLNQHRLLLKGSVV